MGRLLRYIWAGPTTLIGITLVVASLRRGHVAIVDGVIEAHSPFLERALASLTVLPRGADAMTLGHVVIGRDARALEVTRAHERAHVRQYELWGPFFVPAYLLAGVWALLQGGHPYFDNLFEREARQKLGCPYHVDPAEAPKGEQVRITRHDHIRTSTAISSRRIGLPPNTSAER